MSFANIKVGNTVTLNNLSDGQIYTVVKKDFPLVTIAYQMLSGDLCSPRQVHYTLLTTQ